MNLYLKPHIDIEITHPFLDREYQRAMEGKEAADCRYEACNVYELQGGNPITSKSIMV